MANPANYFKPGQSGNPKGRPKRDWTVSGLIEQAMEEENETGVPYKKIVYKNLVKLAIEGDMVAIKEVNQRLDGMPKQTTDLNIKELPEPLLSKADVIHSNNSTKKTS